MKTLLRKELAQLLLLVLPFALAAALWGRIPPTVATHWGLDGRPNGWMPKGRGLLFAPILNLGLCALLMALPRIDPRLRNNPDAGTARYRRSLRVCRYAVTGFIALISVMVIAVAAGWPVNVGRVVYFGLLGMFAVIGNLMGNLQPSYFIGVRTPWTLEDTATWRATHRHIGRLMVFGSAALFALGFWIPSDGQIALLVGFVVTLGLWGAAYSAWFYHRQRRLT